MESGLRVSLYGQGEQSGLWTRMATETVSSSAPMSVGQRFIVRADEKLTAFLELQAAIHRRFEAQLESHA